MTTINTKLIKKVEKRPMSLSLVMVITIVRAWAHGVHGVGYGSCDVNN
jgi:hypothetical protein